MEAIAIVGIGCRFPGADGPDAFWDLLRTGTDAITPVPPSRWEAAESDDPKAQGAGWGGFLEGVDRFDASFFRIAPREATLMDPQQRLLMEASWEALEDAGQPPSRLAGTSVGVFLGVATNDYARWLLADPERIDAHTNTGAAPSIAANRLSYFYDFRGPSMVVDTACSSSLVALHLACQSLRAGESSLALAGGVNLLLSPELSLGFSRLTALSPDGRCKSFDARANGYVRAEGVGMVVLKPLSRAVADGDRIYAVIQASAVNQDGQSNGLTAPNRYSQEALLRDAYRQAGISPGDVQYVEAHGTGTLLGDPIEAQALGTVLAEGRSADRPCRLGSVKSVIGHAEAAAGVAGVIKTALAMHRRQLPANMHFENPNPYIPFDRLPLKVQTRLEDWPHPCIAGVSAFGFGGTNCHVVLASAPEPVPATDDPAEPTARLLALSAQTPDSLAALAGDYAALVDTLPAGGLGDLCHTAALRREHLDQRLAIAFTSLPDLKDKLSSLASGDVLPGVALGKRSGRRRKVVFVFPGQGSQWLGMGRQLFAESEVFRSALERCAAAMAPHLSVPLLEQLFAPEDQAAWEGIDTIQPLIFAVQVALAAVWRSWGVEPQAVVGHSMGEVAAAHVAGALRLEDAARIICLRSHLMKRAAGQGAMALVDLSWDDAKRAIAGYEGRLALAACNGPSSTVLSGDRAAVLELLATLEQQEVFCRLVNVDVASHSPHMDPLLDELQGMLAGITPERPTVPMLSTVTGQMVDGPTLDAAYWARNMREPVLFSPAIQTLGNTKHDLFVEISPHPILTGSVRDALAAPSALVLPSLKRGEAELAVMLGSLAALFTVGQAIDWERVSPVGRFIPLPTYRWQRERYWFDPSTPRRLSARGTKGGHPLLGEPLSLAGHPEERVWQAQVDGRLSFVQDHRVFGATIFPGTAYLEMAHAAASRYFGTSELTLADLELQQALVVSEAETYTVQISLSPAPEGAVRIRLHSRPADSPPDTAWTSHATMLASPRTASPSEPPRPETLRARFETEGPAQAGAEFYRRLRGDGSAYAYGPTFQGIQRLWRGDSEALAQVVPPDALAPDLAAYHGHPALMDACGQAMMAAVSPEALMAGSFLPVGIHTVRLMARPSSEMWCHARCTHQDDGTLEGDVRLYDEHGVIAEFEGLKWRAMEGARSARVEDSLYQVRWQAEPLSLDQTVTPSACLLFADTEATADSLATLLEAKGITCYLALPGPGYERSSKRRFRLRPDAREDMVRLLEAIGATEGPACTTIVHLGGRSPVAGQLLTPAALAAAQTSGCHSVLALIQAIGETAWPQAPRLYLVTAGVQPVADVSASALMEAPMWGLGKTIAQEHPELRCTCLDLEPDPGARDLAGLAAEILADDAETLVAIRSGVRYLERLQPLSESEARPDEVLAFRPDATYLITGGLGALGLLVSRWLADHGARHLLLLGRSAPRGEADQVLSELRQAGVSVTVALADVTDSDQLRTALAATGDGAPLRGVVHAAGLLDDGMLLALDAERFQRVMAPKIGGAWNLHALTRELPLDFFVLFSSASSLLGSSGQGAYAAANAYLDALAHHRRSEGLPALSINWGPWAQVGLAAAEENRGERLAQLGLAGIRPDMGLEALSRLLGSTPAQAAVLPMDWARFGHRAGAKPLYAHLIPEQATEEALELRIPAAGSLRQELLALPTEARQDRLVAYLAQELSRSLRIPVARIDPEVALPRLGLDSLTATELKNRIRDGLECVIPVVKFLEGLSIRDLAEHVLETFEQGTESTAATIDLTQEAVLDPTIVPPADPLPVRAEPETLLLTGATGLLGAYLLHDLLEATPAKVYCLVRAAEPGDAMRRVRENLEAHGLWQEAHATRIEAVHGDLTLPRLGLSGERFAQLAQEVDVIYHCGAEPNHLYPYAALKGPNVIGTQEILRLAFHTRIKPVHMVSTLALFATEEFAGRRVVETDWPERWQSVISGYLQSKWVAEKLVVAAQERGLPVSVYRPGFIGGSQRTGVSNLSDMVCRMVQAWIRMQAAPDAETPLDILPVEVVSQAIVELSLQAPQTDQVFHLIHPRPATWRSLAEHLRAKGYPIRLMPLEEWKHHLARISGDQPDDALRVLQPFFAERAPGEPPSLWELFFLDQSPAFDCGYTWERLAPGMIPCPPLDGRLFDTYLDYMIQVGFVPSVSEQPEVTPSGPRSA